MTPRTPLLFTISALIVLCAMGLCFGGAMTATHPPNWKQVAGRIDSSAAVPMCRATLYAAVGVYSYTALGTRWHGSSLRSGRPRCVSRDSASVLAKRDFPAGRQVVVYYNPDQPDMSLMVLDAPSRGHPYVALAMLLALVLVIATVRSYRAG